MKYFRFKNFNSENKNYRYFITIDDKDYSLVVRWSDECNCAFLSIYDYYNNPIITGRALVNNLIIRNNNLPSVFIFTHLNGETYEPTIDNIADEFGLYYGELDQEEEE